MPLTFAHPAAAVPLAKPLGRVGILSGLVIGSMVPDFVYLLPAPVSRSTSHDLPGLFRFCLPAGLIVFGLFHAALQRPLGALMPASVQRRLGPPGSRRFDGLAVVISILIGALTHIVWDSLTHRDGWGVRALPVMARPLGSISGYDVFPFRVLQHGSTLLGTLLLVRWARRWVRSAEILEAAPPPSLSHRARGLVVGGLLAGAAVVGIVAATAAERGPGPITLGTLPPVVGRGVRSGLQALAVGILLYASSWHATAGSRREARAPHG